MTSRAGSHRNAPHVGPRPVSVSKTDIIYIKKKMGQTRSPRLLEILSPLCMYLLIARYYMRAYHLMNKASNVSVRERQEAHLASVDYVFVCVKTSIINVR